MAGTSAEFTGKVGPHTVQRTPGSDLPSALSCIDPAPEHREGDLSNQNIGLPVFTGTRTLSTLLPTALARSLRRGVYNGIITSYNTPEVSPCPPPTS